MLFPPLFFNRGVLTNAYIGRCVPKYVCGFSWPDRNVLSEVGWGRGVSMGVMQVGRWKKKVILSCYYIKNQCRKAYSFGEDLTMDFFFIYLHI